MAWIILSLQLAVCHACCAIIDLIILVIITHHINVSLTRQRHGRAGQKHDLPVIHDGLDSTLVYTSATGGTSDAKSRRGPL